MRIRKMRIAACCLLITIWTGVAAQQTKPLSNQDVVAMVKAGLDDPTMLMAIQANQEQFELFGSVRFPTSHIGFPPAP